MSWEWRAWMPLEKESMELVPGGADVAPYMGTGIEVANLTEIHFLVHPAVELLAVRRAGSVTKEPTIFTLRVCAERSVRTNVDCWVMQPKLRVPLPEGAQGEAVDAALLQLPVVRAWLRRHAERCTHSDTASPVLDTLASGELQPRTMRMSRRQLRAATPNVAGVILEQSDLMAGGRMWRCVSAHGTSADAVYR